MTCVWKAIASALKIKLKPLELFKHIKKHNTITKDIIWNGQPLTQKLYEQNFKDIHSLENGDIMRGNGYLCGGCAPLLFLVAQIYKVSIEHEHNGHVMRYKNIKHPGKTIYLYSNAVHMWTD